MPNRHGIAALLVAAVSFVVARVFGLIELYVLGSGALLAVLWGLATVRSSLPPLQVQRISQPAIVTVGEPARVDIAMRNAGTRRSPPLELWEPVGPRGGAPMQVDAIRRGDVVRAAYRVPTNRRGLLRLGPLTARRSDVLGLCTRTVAMAGVDEVLVAPRIISLDMPSAGSAGILGQHLQAKSWATAGSEFHSLREYADGDDPRSISWKATARSTTLIVRESTPHGLARCTVLLDCSRCEYDSEQWETAISIAGSVVHAADRALLTTRLVAASADVRGPDVSAASLAVLARAEPIDTPFEITGGNPPHEGLGLVVLVTGTDDSPSVGIARGMARGHDTLVMVCCAAVPRGAQFAVDGTSAEAFVTSWHRLALGGHR
jgi:uncharacterized protein (DUF58 family)